MPVNSGAFRESFHSESPLRSRRRAPLHSGAAPCHALLAQPRARCIAGAAPPLRVSTVASPGAAPPPTAAPWKLHTPALAPAPAPGPGLGSSSQLIAGRGPGVTIRVTSRAHSQQLSAEVVARGGGHVACFPRTTCSLPPSPWPVALASSPRSLYLPPGPRAPTLSARVSPCVAPPSFFRRGSRPRPRRRPRRGRAGPDPESPPAAAAASPVRVSTPRPSCPLASPPSFYFTRVRSPLLSPTEEETKNKEEKWSSRRKRKMKTPKPEEKEEKKQIPLPFLLFPLLPLPFPPLFPLFFILFFFLFLLCSSLLSYFFLFLFFFPSCSSFFSPFLFPLPPRLLPLLVLFSFPSFYPLPLLLPLLLHILLLLLLLFLLLSLSLSQFVMGPHLTKCRLYFAIRVH